MLPSASNKAKLIAKNFSKNSNLDGLGISLTVFPYRTNLKLDNISVTPKMVKQIIMNLDSPKASGPDCITVVILKNWDWTFTHTSWNLQYVSKGDLFSRLSEGLIYGPYI